MENASKALIIAGAILISILLISIGIILINSGRDITGTGVSGVNSQKIQAFNAQFLPYEGKITRFQLEQLRQVVNASNAVYGEEHFVFFNGPDREGVSQKRNYLVILEYSDGKSGTQDANGNIRVIEEGYICEINVTLLY